MVLFPFLEIFVPECSDRLPGLVFPYTLVRGDLFFQRLDLPILQKRHQGSQLEYRPRCSGTADGIVVRLPRYPVLILAQVDHCPDGSGLHIHYYRASSFDDVVLHYSLFQGVVHYVLDIDVYRGADVVTVLHFHDCAVIVPYPSARIAFLHPFHSFRPVQGIVEFPFKSDQAVPVAVVSHAADGPSGESAVRIFSCVYLPDYHAAPVTAFIEKREFLEFQEGGMVDGKPYLFISSVVDPSSGYQPVILVGASVPIDAGESGGQLARLVKPFPVQLRPIPAFHVELFLSHRTVHVDLIHRHRHRKQPPVLGQYGAAHRVCHFLSRTGNQRILVSRVRPVEQLDVYDLENDDECGYKKQGMDGHQDVAHPAAFTRCVLGLYPCQLLFRHLPSVFPVFVFLLLPRLPAVSLCGPPVSREMSPVTPPPAAVRVRCSPCRTRPARLSSGHVLS